VNLVQAIAKQSEVPCGFFFFLKDSNIFDVRFHIFYKIQILLNHDVFLNLADHVFTRNKKDGKDNRAIFQTLRILSLLLDRSKPH
jgi:hypothetical protein